MIHLDRKHHPPTISMHSSPNLILPTTHTDQLKLLSRSPLTRDDKLVQQEHQERPSNAAVEIDLTHLPAPPASDAVSVDETVKTHSSAPPSPGAETPVHRSSSLTPPPESVSPKATSPEVEETAAVEEDATEAEASRHSTPLSELLPPSDQDDSFGDDTKDVVGASEVSDADNQVADGVDDSGETSEIKEEDNKEDLSLGSTSIEQKLQSAVSPRSLSTTSTLISPRPLAESDGKLSSSPERTFTATSPAALKSSVKPSASEFMLSQEPRAGSRQPFVPNTSLTGTPTPSTVKAVRLLELNGELLKCVPFRILPFSKSNVVCNRVCMEFQAQHVPMNDSRFQQ